MHYLLGIDIGTQGTKTAVFDSGGSCLAEAFRKSELIRPSPDRVEEDPERQLDSVCSTIRECIERSGVEPDAVAGISIDGQMAGLVGVGADGKAVTPYDSWLDTRCTPYISLMKKEAGQEIISKSGGPPSFNHGPKILWWLNEQGGVFKKIRSFVPPGSYTAMRLCGLTGAQAFVDKSYLHFSGFADNRKGCWDAGLCRQFRVEMDKLPRIVASSSVVGKLTAEMAGICGLKAGVPIVAGCGDTAASFLSCGATRAGICVDVAGTAAVFATTEEQFQADLKHQIISCGQSATPGLWHPYAYINGGGINLEWFRGKIAGYYAAEILTFDQMEELAGSVSPDTDIPIFIPHLGGRVCPSQPQLRGAWLGLSWDHGLAHLYRAVLEAVALEYGFYMSILSDLYSRFDPKEVRITGGGQKSGAWNRIKADVMGVPVVQVTRSEGAPLGSALMAGFGIGLFSDLNEAAASWISTATTVEADPGRREYYKKRIARYSRLMEAIAASLPGG